MLIKTENYKILLERGETYPTDSRGSFSYSY